MQFTLIATALIATAAPAVARPHFTDPGMQIKPASAASAYCAKRRNGKSHHAALNEAVQENTTTAFGGEAHMQATPGRAGRSDQIEMARNAVSWCPKKVDRTWALRWAGIKIPRIRSSSARSAEPAPAAQPLTYLEPAVKPSSAKRKDCSNKLNDVPVDQRLSVLMTKCL